MQVAGGWWEDAWAASAFDAEPGQAQHDEPLRAELFSAEQMERHGKRLAALHVPAPSGANDRLLARLASNERVLVDLSRRLAETPDAERRFSPAAEWLLDNFYLIEEQIRTARRHLPPGYSRELPRLADGPSAGLPRVYDIALETISHGDGRLDIEGLGGFVSTYQTVTPLRLGELWAIPIMLRLALIENLRRAAARIGAGRADRNHADYWADQMTAMAAKDPSRVQPEVAGRHEDGRRQARRPARGGARQGGGVHRCFDSLNSKYKTAATTLAMAALSPLTSCQSTADHPRIELRQGGPPPR